MRRDRLVLWQEPDKSQFFDCGGFVANFELNSSSKTKSRPGNSRPTPKFRCNVGASTSGELQGVASIHAPAQNEGLWASRPVIAATRNASAGELVWRVLGAHRNPEYDMRGALGTRGITQAFLLETASSPQLAVAGRTERPARLEFPRIRVVVRRIRRAKRGRLDTSTRTEQT
jgi:hypothetical protein